MLLLEDQINRLAYNDALYCASGHRIEMIDPGRPHEPCYCIRYGQTIHYLSWTTARQHVEALVEFVERFDWSRVGLPPISGIWRREAAGASENPLWDQPLADLTLRYPAAAPSVVKAQTRTRVLSTHLALLDPHDARAVRTVMLVTTTRQKQVAMRPYLVRGGLYMPSRRKANGQRHPSGRRDQIIRIDQITRQHLFDMTPSDLAAEGFESWDEFFAPYRSVSGSVKPDLAVWCLRLGRVYTRYEETPPTPVVVRADNPLPMQLELALEMA